MREYQAKTIEELEMLLKSVEGECTIYLETGRYPIRHTLEFTEKQSNITLKANGPVCFDGGIVLDHAEIVDYNETIRMIDLKPYGISLGEYGNRGFRRTYVNAPNELFVDGEAYRVARYPKNGNITYGEGDVVDSGSAPKEKEYDMRNAVIRCEDDRILRWKDARDAYIGGFPCWAYADDCIKIEKIDTEQRTITTTQPHLYSFQANGESNWCIVNLFEELTEPGEYFIDREKEVLYFIPDRDLSGVRLQLSVMDRVMIACEGACHITIEGITFENTRNSAIYIEGGQGVHIRNCTFRNLGIMAVQIGRGAQEQPHGLTNYHGERMEGVSVPKPISREMGSWHEYLYEFAAWDNNGGRDHLIEGCKIYNTGAGGILLSGGNRKSLEPGNNTVYNCEFHDVNRLDKTYKAAVNIMGVGNIIRNCEIYDLPGMAIYLHGNDHLIEYNKIHHVCLMASDCAAIYMGRDMSEVGNVIRHNFIYAIHNPNRAGVGIAAVYFDDSAICNMVYGNLFYDIVSDGTMYFSTIYHNRGGLTSVGNNILVDCYPGLDPNRKTNAWEVMHRDPVCSRRVHTVEEEDIHGVDVTGEVYKQRYPYLYKVYTQNYDPGTSFWNNREYYGQYEDFKDAANLDFTLVEKASFITMHKKNVLITDEVFGLDHEDVMAKPIEFDRMGLVSAKEKKQ